MKILEINKFYFDGRGAERHFFDLIDLLEKKGHQVAVFSMHHPRNKPSSWQKYFVSQVGYQRPEYSWWQIAKGIGRMFFSFESNRKIEALLNDFQPELVHIHNIYHQLSPAILFQIKRRRIPVVMTVHDYKLINPNYNLFHQGKVYDRCHGHAFYQCLADRCIDGSIGKSLIAMLEAYWHHFLGTYRKNIDRFIVPSQYVKNKLVDYGIEESKITVLPHFAPDDGNGNIKPEFEKTGGNYALYFGSVSKSKGVDLLIRVFSTLGKRRLLLAGTAEDGLATNLPSNIEYLGRQNHARLKFLVEKATVVVSGSRLPETFGLVALEALREGTPFVGFDQAGAYHEILQAVEGGGVLVKNEEEMAQIMEKILSGQLRFDREKIKQQAKSVFNADRYYQAFIAVADQAGKNVKIA